MELKIGSEISFKSITRLGSRKATRIVTGISKLSVTVTQYNGWKNFVVLKKEIIEVTKLEPAPVPKKFKPKNQHGIQINTGHKASMIANKSESDKVHYSALAKFEEMQLQKELKSDYLYD